MRLRLLATIIVLGLPLHPPRTASADDAAELKAIVEKFYAVFSKKDVEKLMALWSPSSPYYAAHKDTAQREAVWFDTTVANLAFSRIRTEGGKASLRVSGNAVSTDTTTRETRKPRITRTFEFVREGGPPSESNVPSKSGSADVWKVWRYYTTVEDLVPALSRLALSQGNEEKKQADIQALLSNDKELVTPELAEGLVWEGHRLVDALDFERSRVIYRLALEVAYLTGDKEGIAATLFDVASANQNQDNLTEAIGYLERGLPLFEETGNRWGMARCLGHLGDAHGFLGDYSRALEHHLRSLSLFRALGHQYAIGAELRNVGQIQQLQGNYAQALEYFEKSLTVPDWSRNHVGITYTTYNIATIHRLRGNYVQALLEYEKVLKLSEDLRSKRIVPSALTGIGLVHRAQGDQPRALEYYEKALKLADDSQDKRAISSIHLCIGRLQHERGQYALSLESSEQAAAVAREIGGRETLWQALTAMGRTYRSLNEPGRARKALDEAINIIESIRTRIAGGEREAQRFFEGKVSPYQSMIDLLIAERNGEAFNYAERARARALLDVLQGGRVRITKAMTRDEREQERRLIESFHALNGRIYDERQQAQPDQARVAELTARLEKTRLEHEAFRTSVYAAHPELRSQRGEMRPVTMVETSGLMTDAHCAVLEFVATEENLYLFVITKDNGRVHTLNVNRKELGDRVSRFREKLARRDLEFREPARQLYDLLLKPAHDQLKDKTTLVIVPDGELWELPFQALLSTQGRYLVEDHAVSYAPSLTALREMSRKRNASSTINHQTLTLLAVGNPAGLASASSRAQAQLGSHSVAEQDVAGIARLYGKNHSKVYLGPEANEAIVKTEVGSARILHFATHGVFDDRSPMYSHLVLSQGSGFPDGTVGAGRVQGSDAKTPNQQPKTKNQKEDGLLEAWEMMDLDLNAELVVLSACETARGKIGAGEGIIGMTWALFVAGCPATVASQWKVGDRSTSELMLEFHHNLKSRTNPKSEISKSEALRRAQLKLLHSREMQYHHPFYWAGFVLIGDGR